MYMYFYNDLCFIWSKIFPVWKPLTNVNRSSLTFSAHGAQLIVAGFPVWWADTLCLFIHNKNVPYDVVDFEKIIYFFFFFILQL